MQSSMHQCVICGENNYQLERDICSPLWHSWQTCGNDTIIQMEIQQHRCDATTVVTKYRINIANETKATMRLINI